MAAVPFGIGGEPRFELRQAPLGVLRAGCGHHRHDRVHHLRVGDGPLERLIAAIGRPGDRDQVAHAQAVEQRLLRGHDVAHRDRRKIRAVRLAGARVGAGAIGRAVGRAQHVRGDDKELVGVDRLARPDQPVPPPRLIAVGRVTAGGVMAAGVAMGDQHRVAAVGREPAIGLVGDRGLGQDRAALQAKIADQELLVLDRAEIAGACGKCDGHGPCPLCDTSGRDCAMAPAAPPPPRPEPAGITLCAPRHSY